jgi:hypothetical protein
MSSTLKGGSKWLTRVGSAADAWSAFKQFQAGNNVRGSLDAVAAILNFMGVRGQIASLIITGGQEYYKALQGEYGTNVAGFLKDFGISELIEKANKAITTENIDTYQRRLDLIDEKSKFSNFRQLAEESGSWSQVIKWAKVVSEKTGLSSNKIINGGIIIYEGIQGCKEMKEPNPNDPKAMEIHYHTVFNIWADVIAKTGVFLVAAAAAAGVIKKTLGRAAVKAAAKAGIGAGVGTFFGPGVGTAIGGAAFGLVSFVSELVLAIYLDKTLENSVVGESVHELAADLSDLTYKMIWPSAYPALVKYNLLKGPASSPPAAPKDVNPAGQPAKNVTTTDTSFEPDEEDEYQKWKSLQGTK